MAHVTKPQTNPMIEFHKKYRADPVKWVKEVLKASPFPWQEEVLEDIIVGRKRRMSIRSGHGVGKTTVMAWAMIHTIQFNAHCKVVCTAPAASTLFDNLMAEVKTWINRMPDFLRQLFDPTSDHVRVMGMGSEAFISARTSSSDKPEALAGIHAPRVLLVVDEASGVDEPVFASAAGSMSTSNATTVLIGNPTRNSGFFFETHHRLADIWDTYHVSSFDVPLVDEDFIKSVERQHGKDSNEYRIRVLGEFPSDDGEGFIPRDVIEAAMERDLEADDKLSEVWGLDVARTGNDKSALARRRGAVVPEIKSWGDKNLMETVGIVKAMYDSAPEGQKPEEIMVDGIGMGAGVADRLVELGLPAVAVNVSESSGVMGVGMRLRDELWYRGKTALLDHGISLPKSEILAGELAAPRYEYMSNGRLKIEGKREMKRRGLKSPNEADAFLLTLFSNKSPYDTISTLPRGASQAYYPRGDLSRDLGAVV